MVILILILINIVNILYVYLKYYKSSQFIDDNIKNRDSIIIGYINDNGFNNNFDLILAEIIELNIKGYITIEYSEDDFDRYNYTIKQNIDIISDKLNRYEMLVMNFLFEKKMEITKIELEEKLKNTFHSYNLQFNEIISLLNEQLERENIIDRNIQKEFSKKTRKYIIISVILVLLLIIFGTLRIIELSLFDIYIYIIEKVFLSVLLLKVNLYTDIGKNIQCSINNYKSELKEKEFLTDKNPMKNVVMNKEFANSIALHINTQAKKVFIDENLARETIKMSKKQCINALIIFAITILLGLIISKISMILPTNSMFWFYLAIIMIIAITADVAYFLNQKK